MNEEGSRPGGPAELPEGGEGFTEASHAAFRPRPGTHEIPRVGTTSAAEFARFPPRPGPQELPWEVTIGRDTLVLEVFRLRERLHSLESQILIGSLRGGRPPRPNELPEGGEGGGGGFVPRPRPGEIAELPVFDALSRLEERITVLESRIQTLTDRLEQTGGQ